MAVKKKYVSPNKKGRQLLVGDIHGCSRTLDAMLIRIDLQKDDQIFFVGDYINKGPDSKGVLDTLIALNKNHQNVYFLRGNNESYFYKTLKKNEARVLRLARRYKVEDLFKYEGTKFYLKKGYRKFLKSTLHYIESDDFFVVHAGFDFKSEIPFYNTFDMLWMRNFKSNKELQKFKPVIHGHKITPIKQIRKAVKKEKYDIPIDNGCVLGSSNDDYGRLICFDITNRMLIEQENVESEVLTI
jgi:serine/threonine protein phosphatase 1